jgi:AcrR family transcriptional regulator
MPRGTPSLTQERIVEAAAALASERGLDRLTMRDLARTLGVGTMSLYYHVADKSALEDALTEYVWAQIELPADPPPGDWQERLRTMARSWRRVMLENHALLPLMLTRRYTGPHGLAPVEELLDALGDAGFDAPDGVRCFRLLSAYVVGFVESEVARSLRDPGATAAAISEGTIDRPRPRLRAALRAAATLDSEDEFAFGLDAIVDSLARLRPGGG